MLILGISAFYHDSAVSLVKDGEVIFAAQEDRFSRKKHDSGFPERSLQACLKTTGIRTEDLDYAVFYEKPLWKLDRLFSTYMQFAPRGIRSFLKAVPVWAKQRIFIADIIRNELKRKDLKVLFTTHHESHVGAAFYPSPFPDAAVITIDAVGEWDTLTISHGQGNSFKILKRIAFPHSLGLLYSAFTYFTGFKVNSGEYKLMGLAPYGEPVYKDLILKELIDLREDGSFRLNLKYFNFTTGLTMTGSRFERLFGVPRRKPETEIRQADMDLAASIQVVLEEAMDKIARTAKTLAPSDNLCLAGGVALNCVANGKILKSRIFKNIWIQPAAGDAGAARGAALVVWYQHFKNPRNPVPGRDFQKGSFLGPSYSREEIKAFLDENRIAHRERPRPEMAKTVARLIDENKVVGFFQGPMEFGPRALGARSILGDARSSEMQSKMNLKIKFRESFRPFAPSVLEEKLKDWFDYGDPTPYMLLVYNVREDKRLPLSEADRARKGLAKLPVRRSIVPAITHVDFSARVHSVAMDVNPYYHAVIEEFEKRTGCPVIINTSFNVRGEPIVQSPQDAYRCFMRTNMDVLVLDTFLIEKQEKDFIQVDESWMKEFPLD
ncbi:MAG: carbamoyltransferase [Candidatus Aminicenantes bacterium]|nr:carbamoyltransferase [Candidatus Aminicenantes bacterium]